MTEELQKLLKEGVVTFEFKKKDGSIRTAKGTLNENYIPKVEVENICLHKKEIDILIKEKYKDLQDYMDANKIELVSISEDNEDYIFKLKKRKVKKNENLIFYYDLEKESFRSFNKENFIRIISE